jgi:hypothetical protein
VSIIISQLCLTSSIKPLEELDVFLRGAKPIVALCLCSSHPVHRGQLETSQDEVLALWGALWRNLYKHCLDHLLNGDLILASQASKAIHVKGKHSQCDEAKGPHIKRRRLSLRGRKEDLPEMIYALAKLSLSLAMKVRGTYGALYSNVPISVIIRLRRGTAQAPKSDSMIRW